MRKLLFLLMALPFANLVQSQNLISTSRYFPKAGMWQKFEAALGTHAKKYHKNDFKWKVFSIETGPDAGGYMVVEGPNNWEKVDGRGDLGAEHTADWEKTVQIHLQDRTNSTYYEYHQEWSSMEQTHSAENVSLQHFFINPGYRGEFIQHILLPMKNLWQSDGTKVAVYDATISGRPQIVVATRYLNGLKERDVSNPVNFQERFKKVNGGDATWNKWIEIYKVAVRDQWQELITWKPKLGSN